MTGPQPRPWLDPIYASRVLAGLAGASAVLWWRIGRPDEGVLRIIGTVLQLVGVGTVAKNIRDTRREFDKSPGLLERAANWVERLFRTPKVIELSARSAVSATGRATMTAVGHAPIVTTSLEDQVVALDRALSALRSDVDRRLPELRLELVTKAENPAAQERQAREQAISEQRDRFKNVLTGGLKLSMFGVICIVIGTVLGTLPQETVYVVAWCLHRL